MKFEKFTEYSTVGDVIGDAAFKNFGRLLFPVYRPLSGKMTLKEVSSSQVYLWYSHIQVEKTLDILNTLKERALEGEQVFYPIYTQREMAADGTKRDTGLFFFRGKPGKEFAVMNAGGAFYYVGAMHDSFPHALEAGRQGYQAFALIYRPDSPYEDLARAIEWIWDHAGELQIKKRGVFPLGRLRRGQDGGGFGKPDLSEAVYRTEGDFTGRRGGNAVYRIYLRFRPGRSYLRLCGFTGRHRGLESHEAEAGNFRLHGNPHRISCI